MLFEEDSNKEQPALAPISSLPLGIYPPSAYPPPSYFESSSLPLPALIIPSQRTSEIQKLLKEVIFKEVKRKSVYPVEVGIDYSPHDVSERKYDPKKERKIVLIRLGDPLNTDDTTPLNDPVFVDPRVKALLESSLDNEVSQSATAPVGKMAVRKSHISLPASPYSLMTVDQVLRRLLPTAEGSTSNDTDNQVDEIPSSFEIAGHIAHVNLRSESLPYKYLIGKAILDKNPRIRVVVNKIGNIENEFRTFPMEIIAGEGLHNDSLDELCQGKSQGETRFTVDKNAETGMQIQMKIGEEHQSLMEVQLKEHGCRFTLDFARVYWNSRLQGEHGRLVQYIVQAAKSSCMDVSDGKKNQCVVADAMAGVGPFAVPLTSANSPHFNNTPIICHANDLNPISYKYLQMNAKINRCFSYRLQTYNLDARQFIHKMNAENIQVDHFIMNLPQMAPEFLDAFRGWKFNEALDTPMIHVHCFDEKARTPEDHIRIEKNTLQRCEKALGCPGCLVDSKSKYKIEVRVIRDVGPRKNMLCVSFQLPREVEDVDKLNCAEGLPVGNKRPRDTSNSEESDECKRSKEG